MAEDMCSNLFDLIVTRTARNPGEATVTTWQCDETHHVVPDHERLQVRFSPDTGVLLVTAHRRDTDTYPLSVQLVGARLLRADEYGVVYAGFTAVGDRRLACEVYLSRDDVWNIREPRVEYAATDVTTVELGQHETIDGLTTYPTADAARAAFVGDGDDVLLRRVTSGWQIVADDPDTAQAVLDDMAARLEANTEETKA